METAQREYAIECECFSHSRHVGTLIQVYALDSHHWRHRCRGFKDYNAIMKVAQQLVDKWGLWSSVLPPEAYCGGDIAPYWKLLNLQGAIRLFLFKGIEYVVPMLDTWIFILHRIRMYQGHVNRSRKQTTCNTIEVCVPISENPAGIVYTVFAQGSCLERVEGMVAVRCIVYFLG